jgi:hypothetical protein
MIEIVLASPAHVGPIATRMRAADRLECGAFGRSPKEALRLGIQSSTVALTAKLDGRAVAMFGVTPTNLIDSRGVPWFLGTDDVYAHPRELMRRGPRILSALSASYRRLENVVWTGNDRAIRMLRWWGFTVEGDSIDVGGLPFHRFWRQA